MTAKEYLKQYKEECLRVRRYQEEYDAELLLIDTVRSTSDNDGMPHGSGISKPTEQKAIRLAAKARELKDATLEAVRIRQEVFDLIKWIPGEKGDVLYERYINLKSWSEVAAAVGYSERHVYNIHREALAEVDRLLK